MAVALLLGAGIGLGLVLVASGLWPARLTLTHEFLRLHQGSPAPEPATTGWVGKLGRPLARSFVAHELAGSAVRRDLTVCEKNIDRYLGEKAGCALIFALLGPAVYAVVVMADVAVPWQVPAWSMPLLGVLGFFVPDLALKSQAAARRSEVRHALSAFLDLVVVSLAGGRGVDGALADASKGGSGWAFVRLRATLVAATSARRTPWSALGEMGTEYGVRELSELAASVALAGTEGARVRASLVAKATSMRAHQLADIEGSAQAATERMSVVTVGLFAGFLIFLGYPAIAAVLAGF
jgi:tight adherence protein C